MRRSMLLLLLLSLLLLRLLLLCWASWPESCLGVPIIGTAPLSKQICSATGLGPSDRTVRSRGSAALRFRWQPWVVVGVALGRTLLGFFVSMPKGSPKGKHKDKARSD